MTEDSNKLPSCSENCDDDHHVKDCYVEAFRATGGIVGPQLLCGAPGCVAPAVAVRASAWRCREHALPQDADLCIPVVGSTLRDLRVSPVAEVGARVTCSAEWCGADATLLCKASNRSLCYLRCAEHPMDGFASIPLRVVTAVPERVCACKTGTTQVCDVCQGVTGNAKDAPERAPDAGVPKRRVCVIATCPCHDEGIEGAGLGCCRKCTEPDVDVREERCAYVSSIEGLPGGTCGRTRREHLNEQHPFVVASAPAPAPEPDALRDVIEMVRDLAEETDNLAIHARCDYVASRAQKICDRADAMLRARKEGL